MITMPAVVAFQVIKRRWMSCAVVWFFDLRESARGWRRLLYLSMWNPGTVPNSRRAVWMNELVKLGNEEGEDPNRQLAGLWEGDENVVGKIVLDCRDIMIFLLTIAQLSQAWHPSMHSHLIHTITTRLVEWPKIRRWLKIRKPKEACESVVKCRKKVALCIRCATLIWIVTSGKSKFDLLPPLPFKQRDDSSALSWSHQSSCLF